MVNGYGPDAARAANERQMAARQSAFDPSKRQYAPEMPGNVYGPTFLQNISTGGQRYRWDEQQKRYVLVPATTTGGGGGGGGGAFTNIYRQADLQRQALALPYRGDIAGYREQERLARAGGAEGVSSFGLARGAGSVSGGVEELALQRILDAYRAQEAAVGGDIAQREAQYRQDLFGVEQNLAEAVYREALARASRQAAKIQAGIINPAQMYLNEIAEGQQ